MFTQIYIFRFHGKCVGITKAQGKELEEAGKDWRCPTCIELNNKVIIQSEHIRDISDHCIDISGC